MKKVHISLCEFYELVVVHHWVTHREGMGQKVGNAVVSRKQSQIGRKWERNNQTYPLFC